VLVKYEFPQGKLRPTLQFGGFINHEVSSDYNREYELIDTNGNLVNSTIITDSPLAKVSTGLTFGIGLNFKAFNNREVFIDFNYRKFQILKDFEGFFSNDFLIQVGIPLTNKRITEPQFTSK